MKKSHRAMKNLPLFIVSTPACYSFLSTFLLFLSRLYSLYRRWVLHVKTTYGATARQRAPCSTWAETGKAKLKNFSLGARK
jgi:hypothetical protein